MAAAADLRARVGARQAYVLEELLHARVPDGFDLAGALATSRVLALKRASAAARTLPVLRTVRSWPASFVEYAMSGRPAECAAHDARAYIEWLRRDGDPDDRRWVAVETVRSGARRWAYAPRRPVFRIAGRVVGASPHP